MNMDKKTVLAIIIIILIMLLTPKYMEFTGLNKKQITETDTLQTSDIYENVDSNNTFVKKVEEKKLNIKKEIVKSEPDEEIKDFNQSQESDFFKSFSDTVTYEISTPLTKITISNKMGGNITNLELKKYNHYQNEFVNLIDNNYFNFSFIGESGKVIETKDYVAQPIFYNESKSFELNEYDAPLEISFKIMGINDEYIKRTFIISPDKYDVKIVQEYVNVSNSFRGNYIDYQWVNGIPLVEEAKKDDKYYNGALIYMGGELEYVNADDEDINQEFNGKVNWTSVRNKYFAIYLKALEINNTEGVSVSCFSNKDISDSVKNVFKNTIVFKNRKTNNFTDSLLLYLGPLDYSILKKYDADFEELVMNRSWYEKITRPITLLMIPIFSFLYSIIGNYGFVIIIFSVLLKLLLFPLTKKSYQSMKEMAILQPVISELKEKYKDNPQKMNKELMGIYKKHGVNPMGGCLPNILQMPILFAMFSLFRSTIQLRGESFIFWIKDLSSPDVINLGFSLPLIGSTLHILPILSSFSMIFQSKQTSTDPKNKALVYMMPFMMLFFLYSFPSGLHLYYFVFNILSYLQQKMISEPEPIINKPSKGKRK